MPCHTMRTIEYPKVAPSVALADKDLDLMKKALESLGFAVRLTGSKLAYSGVNSEDKRYYSGSYDGKRLVGELAVNTVKKAYAAQVVFKQFGSIGLVTKMSATKFSIKLKV